LPDAEGPWLVVASIKVDYRSYRCFSRFGWTKSVFGEAADDPLRPSPSGWSRASQEEALQEPFRSQWRTYEAARKAKAAPDEFVKAVRDRVKAAAEVFTSVPPDDMRAEETQRDFFKAAPPMLPSCGPPDEADHVTRWNSSAAHVPEVDKKLYFPPPPPPCAESLVECHATGQRQQGLSGR
jgi:hypothetical protein